MSVSYRKSENTVTLQKSNQLIGIELLTSYFLDNLGALFQSQGGNARFTRFHPEDVHGPKK